MIKPYSLTLSPIIGAHNNSYIIAKAVVNEGVETKLLQREKEWKIRTEHPKSQIEVIRPSIEREADRWFESIKKDTNELASK